VPCDKIGRHTDGGALGCLGVDDETAVERIPGTLGIGKQAGQRAGRT
jgi:hypothetical protein